MIVARLVVCFELSEASAPVAFFVENSPPPLTRRATRDSIPPSFATVALMGGFINERDQRAEAHASLVSGLPSLTCEHVHVCMYHMCMA